MMQAQIRSVQLEDIPRVSEIDSVAFGEMSYSLLFLRQAADLWPSLFKVAVEDDTIIGYALGALAETGDTMWILALAVESTARRRGIGNTLCQDVLASAIRVGAKNAILTVRPDNTPARRIFAVNGFQDERLSEDYFGTGHARLILTRHLE